MNELFLKIINMSISASWLILAVLILRLVLKKAPKWVNVLLWGIVAVRLICPLSFESALSLIPSSETIPLDIEMAAKPTIDSGVPAINSVVNPVLSSFAPPQHVLTSANPLQIWIPILNIIWLIGVGALLLYTAVSYWRLCRKVDTAVRYKGNIFQSENVSSPFVLGIIKPRIYLPFNMNGQDLEHVVAHEQAHIRRKDHWWKPLGFLLLTIHWFNPLMWLAYVLLCRDIEFACDEKVIKELGNEQRADYTQALVVCSVNRRMIAACPLAFGEVGVKDRVKSVMNYKKPAFWIIILAVIACVIVAVCFLTNPMGFQFDEATHTIVSANHFDMRNADDAVAIEMNPAQISELSSRLAGVKNTKKSDEYGGFTPGYQISALLEDGTYIRINGYSLSDNDMVDIEWNGERYVVSDGEFQDYLSRICVGGDVAVAEPVPSVTKWFDYRRQLVLTTKEKPTDRADDPDLAEKMKTEAEGIFLWALEGLQRLVANNFQFTESDRIRENREAVKRDNNNIFDFMESEGYIRRKADASISSKDFYEIYRMWCEENSLAPLKARSFSDAMIANAGRFNLEHCNNITNSAGRRVWGFMGVEAIVRPHINGFYGDSPCTYVPEEWRQVE